MQKIHKEDRSNRGYTVCGLLITQRRVKLNLITTTQSKCTCYQCGENHGVVYFKTVAAFITNLYKDEKYYLNLGEFKITQAKKEKVCTLFITKSKKYLACIKDTKGIRRVSEIELACTRVGYNIATEAANAKENERVERLKTKEAEYQASTLKVGVTA